MLRTWLLVTTILTVVGSVSFSAGEARGISGDRPRDIAMHAAGGQDNAASALEMRTQFGKPVRDRNMDFLCTYGYLVYYQSTSYSGQIYFTDWQHYAVPIKGKGTSVREIVVTDARYAQTRSPSVNVGIYSDANGQPGNLIAGGIGRAKGSCHLTRVAIAKTFLKAGKKYWVEEDAPRQITHGINGVFWGYKADARHNALYQYYSSSDGSSYLSDWLPASGPAPFVNVR